MSIKFVAITLFCLSVLLVPFVKADETTESFTVYTDKQEYLIGETVNVYVKAESIDPDQNITVTDIVVYGPGNSTVAEWSNLSVVLTDTETPVLVGTLTATLEGEYTVSASALGCPWRLRARWWFWCWFWHPPCNVVPEVPFGTITAIATLLGAAGIYAKRKK